MIASIALIPHSRVHPTCYVLRPPDNSLLFPMAWMTNLQNLASVGICMRVITNPLSIVSLFLDQRGYINVRILQAQWSFATAEWEG